MLQWIAATHVSARPLPGLARDRGPRGKGTGHMRIVCIGGGPAGLYLGILMKLQNPRHAITVIERNRPYDTFGFGVVFSDATMENMRKWDARTADQIETRS